MRNKYLSLFLLPLLVSCNSYRGVKYELNYEEDASLKEITPYQMFEIGALNKTDSVFLIAGLEGCSSCKKAKEDVEVFIIKKHVSIYYIDINKVTYSESYDLDNYPETDYYHIYYSSVYANEGEADFNSLPTPEDVMNNKALALPQLCFFKYGAIGTKINNDCYNYLNKFVKVIK